MTLKLSNVGYVYGAGTSFAHRALDAVSLDLEVGEFVLVLGPTGSGKSTLLRVAAGLLPVSCGSVVLDGTCIDGPLFRSPGGVGLVFQTPENQLFAERVIDDVMFGPRNLGMTQAEATDAAREAMEAVGLSLEAFAERSPFTLSGGEARRVALAGVLAMRPQYLLLDEPTSGLDANGRAAVTGAMMAACKEAGLLVVSHDAEEFLGLADRVLILVDGRTAYYGPAEALVEDPSPFAMAGLRPPEVLQTQILARDAGMAVESFTLDPALAAQWLFDAHKRRQAGGGDV